jgi:hypothetical protein
MCIVIDVNAIPAVFDQMNKDHNEFMPVLKWLKSNRIKIVYGGTKYKKELSKMLKFLPLMADWERAGKIHKVDDERVDALESQIIQQTANNKKCNDQAIIAIVIISHCRLVCSKDKESYPFLKDKKLYPKYMNLPNIYTGLRDVALLIHRRCGPCSSC